ncbi:hypothetical protein [Nocardiopsis sp. RV163]|uniref:hypothetical protein n=1 Tax=Nocardiopsis sp. RV163 TaxID=1661388 RepID=UPI001364D136|nr:hypothetical protein [Nocardiopsis sp. RV163]
MDTVYAGRSSHSRQGAMSWAASVQAAPALARHVSPERSPESNGFIHPSSP